MNRFSLFFFAATFLGTFASNSTSAFAILKPKLIIYTYDSFVSEWGPGPTLKASFESKCSCEILWVPVADGAAMLARLEVEKTRTKADIVLGIDDTLITTADKTGLFTDIGVEIENSALPQSYSASTKFVPFDFGYYSFMFDTHAKQKSGKPYPRPASMNELLTLTELSHAVIIQDPRTSAPGLGLLLWFHSLYGHDAGKKLTELKRQVLTVGKGWTQSYGLFTKGEAPIVLSYSTSEAYHRESEKTDRYQALNFKEGHYLALETAAILNSSKNKDLAVAFLKFLTRDAAQASIASMNWMFPVTKVSSGIPAAYKQVQPPAKVLRLSSDEVFKNRKEWVREWMDIFGK
jgi:thiamine transport system substrate-binding protein